MQFLVCSLGVGGLTLVSVLLSVASLLKTVLMTEDCERPEDYPPLAVGPTTERRPQVRRSRLAVAHFR